MKIIWIHYARPRTSWYELDEATQAEHTAAWKAADEVAIGLGAGYQGTFTIRGQGDFSTLELWSFESAEAAFDYWATRVDLGYAQWFAYSNQLGSSLPG